MVQELQRELEKEEEEEVEEQTCQVASATPGSETDWEYKTAWSAFTALHVPKAKVRGACISPSLEAAFQSCVDIHGCTTRCHNACVHVCVACAQADALVSALPGYIGRAIRWSPNVYVTANFAATTTEGDAGTEVSGEYLRPASAALVWPDDSALLLTDREADAVLALLWRGGDNNLPADSEATLVWCGFATLPHPGSPAPPLALSLGPQVGTMQPVQAACVRLFNGATHYGGAAGGLLQRLRAMLRHPSAREACQALISMRGRSPHFERSDLEQACE